MKSLEDMSYEELEQYEKELDQQIAGARGKEGDPGQSEPDIDSMSEEQLSAYERSLDSQIKQAKASVPNGDYGFFDRLEDRTVAEGGREHYAGQTGVEATAFAKGMRQGRERNEDEAAMRLATGEAQREADPNGLGYRWEDGSGESEKLPDGETNQWGGNLRNEGRKPYFYRDANGKISGYGTTRSTVVEKNGEYYVVPTLTNGEDMMDEKVDGQGNVVRKAADKKNFDEMDRRALSRLEETGEYWAKFNDKQEAIDFASGQGAHKDDGPHATQSKSMQKAWNEYIQNHWDEMSPEVQNDPDVKSEHERRQTDKGGTKRDGGHLGGFLNGVKQGLKAANRAVVSSTAPGLAALSDLNDVVKTVGGILSSNESTHSIGEGVEAARSKTEQGLLNSPGISTVKNAVRAITDINNKPGATEKLVRAARDAGIDDDAISQAAKDSGGDFYKFGDSLKGLAESQLEHYDEKKRTAQIRMQANPEGLGSKVLTVPLDMAPVIQQFMIANGLAAGAGLLGNSASKVASGTGWAQRLLGAGEKLIRGTADRWAPITAVGAMSASNRYGELTADDYSYDPVKDKMVVEHKGEGKAKAALEAGAGGLAEGWLYGGPLGEMLGAGAKAVFAKAAQKALKPGTLNVLNKTLDYMGKVSKYTGFHGQPTQIALMDIDTVIDQGLGLNVKDSEYRGFAKEWDALRNGENGQPGVLSLKGQAEMFVSMVGLMAAHGAGAFAKARADISSRGRAADAILKTYFDAPDELLKKMDPSVKEFLSKMLMARKGASGTMAIRNGRGHGGEGELGSKFVFTPERAENFCKLVAKKCGAVTEEQMKQMMSYALKSDGTRNWSKGIDPKAVVAVPAFKPAMTVNVDTGRRAIDWGETRDFPVMLPNGDVVTVPCNTMTDEGTGIKFTKFLQADAGMGDDGWVYLVTDKNGNTATRFGLKDAVAARDQMYRAQKLREAQRANKLAFINQLYAKWFPGETPDVYTNTADYERRNGHPFGNGGDVASYNPDTDKATYFLDNIETPEQLTDYVMHEVGRHKGIRTAFEVKDEAGNVDADATEKRVQQFFKQLAKNDPNYATQLEFMATVHGLTPDQVLADPRLAEETFVTSFNGKGVPVERGVMDKTAITLRRMLRGAFKSLPYSRAEQEALLRGAMERMSHETGGAVNYIPESEEREAVRREMTPQEEYEARMERKANGKEAYELERDLKGQRPGMPINSDIDRQLDNEAAKMNAKENELNWHAAQMQHEDPQAWAECMKQANGDVAKAEELFRENVKFNNEQEQAKRNEGRRIDKGMHELAERERNKREMGEAIKNNEQAAGELAAQQEEARGKAMAAEAEKKAHAAQEKKVGEDWQAAEDDRNADELEQDLKGQAKVPGHVLTPELKKAMAQEESKIGHEEKARTSAELDAYRKQEADRIAREKAEQEERDNQNRITSAHEKPTDNSRTQGERAAHFDGNPLKVRYTVDEYGNVNGYEAVSVGDRDTNAVIAKTNKPKQDFDSALRAMSPQLREYFGGKKTGDGHTGIDGNRPPVTNKVEESKPEKSEDGQNSVSSAKSMFGGRGGDHINAIDDAARKLAEAKQKRIERERDEQTLDELDDIMGDIDVDEDGPDNGQAPAAPVDHGPKPVAPVSDGSPEGKSNDSKSVETSHDVSEMLDGGVSESFVADSNRKSVEELARQVRPNGTLADYKENEEREYKAWLEKNGKRDTESMRRSWRESDDYRMAMNRWDEDSDNYDDSIDAMTEEFDKLTSMKWDVSEKSGNGDRIVQHSVDEDKLSSENRKVLKDLRDRGREIIRDSAALGDVFEDAKKNGYHPFDWKDDGVGDESVNDIIDQIRKFRSQAEKFQNLRTDNDGRRLLYFNNKEDAGRFVDKVITKWPDDPKKYPFDAFVKYLARKQPDAIRKLGEDIVGKWNDTVGKRSGFAPVTQEEYNDILKKIGGFDEGGKTGPVGGPDGRGGNPGQGGQPGDGIPGGGVPPDGPGRQGGNVGEGSGPKSGNPDEKPTGVHGGDEKPDGGPLGGTGSGGSGKTSEGGVRGNKVSPAVSNYEAKNLHIPGLKKSTSPLEEPRGLRGTDAPEITVTPNIDKKFYESGDLQEHQVQAIAQAKQIHASPSLDNGSRRGILLGHRMGAGKTRMVAGVMLDNWNDGRKQALWFSVNNELMPDIYSDLTPFGLQNELYDVGDGKAKAKGIGFATYSDIIKEGFVDNLAKRLGKDFDGVIAFDECHRAKTEFTLDKDKKPDRGKTQYYVNRLQELLPKARVVYLSATSATEVSDLGYAQRLGIWGEKDSPFKDFDEFKQNIRGKNLAGMEEVARTLKRRGQYLSCGLSNADVEFKRVKVPTSDTVKRDYVKYNDAVRSVCSDVYNSLMMMKNLDYTVPIGILHGMQQRMHNSMMSALKLPSVIEMAKKDIAEGRTPVFSLVYTNAAGTERAVGRKLANGERAEMDETNFGPKQILREFLDTKKPKRQYGVDYEDYDFPTMRFGEPKVGPDGTETYDPPKMDAASEALRKRLIKLVDGLPDDFGNPINMIMDAFGKENVANLTGLNKENFDTDYKAFKDGKKKVLVFSKKANTGYSFHTHPKYANSGSQRVMYVLQPGWRADEFDQTLGRVHRNGQVSAPIIVLPETDIPGEARFVSSVARRHGQMSSFTQGDRRQGADLIGEEDNYEDGYMKDAIKGVIGHFLSIDKKEVDDLASRMNYVSLNRDGMPVNKLLAIDKKTNKLVVADIKPGQFFNRMMLLDPEEQGPLFDMLLNARKQLIQNDKDDGKFDPGLQETGSLRDEELGSVNVAPDMQIKHINSYYKTNKSSYDDFMKRFHKKGPEGQDVVTGKPVFVRNKRTGRVYAYVEDGTKKRGEQGMVGAVRRFSVDGEQERMYQSQLENRNVYEVLDEGAAKEAWNKEFDATPDERSSDEIYARGDMLRHWNDVIGAKLPKTFFLKPGDGKREFTGARLDIADIMRINKSYGATSGHRISDMVKDSVVRKMRNGESVELADGHTVSAIKHGMNNELVVRGFKNPAEAREFAGRVNAQLENENLEYRAYADQKRVFIPDEAKTVKSFIDGNPANLYDSNDVKVGTTRDLYFNRNEERKDADEIRKAFDKSEKVKSFRTFLRVGDKLYSPVATMEKDANGKYAMTKPVATINKDGTVSGDIMVAREDYDTGHTVIDKKTGRPKTWIDKDGNEREAYYVTLKKENGQLDDIARNPYAHSSNSMLNDQFTNAYKRDLVTVECEISKDDLASGYMAKNAKNSVGEHPWHTGIVAADLPNENRRNVYLTRAIKPVRIVSDAEAARHIADELGPRRIEMRPVVRKGQPVLMKDGKPKMKAVIVGMNAFGSKSTRRDGAYDGRVFTSGVRDELEKLGMKIKHGVDREGILYFNKTEDASWNVAEKRADKVLDRDYAPAEAKRIRDNFKRLNGTAWHGQALESLLIRDDMKSLMDGKKPTAGSKLMAPSAVKIREAIAKGPDGMLDYLRSHGAMSGAEKCVHAINSSYLDCDPSKECAEFCYAANGNYAFVGPAAKSEMISYLAQKRPAELAKLIAEQYKVTGEFAAGKALRMFDKGDISPAMVRVIKQLNGRGIHCQVFAKRPDLLRKLDRNFNQVMLSIDQSNLDKAEKNPDLPLSFVFKGTPEDIAFLEKNRSRYEKLGGVILPITGDKKIDPSKVADLVPGWARRYRCPISSGVKKMGEWNCTMCDAKSGNGMGCFHKRTSAMLDRIKDGPFTETYKGELDEQFRGLEDLVGRIGDESLRRRFAEELDSVRAAIRSGNRPEGPGGKSSKAGGVRDEKSGRPGSAGTDGGKSGSGDLYFNIGEDAGRRVNARGIDDARQMDKDGKDRREIWAKTGWWKAKDGKWRYEIPGISEEDTTRLMDFVRNSGKFYDRDTKSKSIDSYAFTLETLEDELKKAGQKLPNSLKTLVAAYPRMAKQRIVLDYKHPKTLDEIATRGYSSGKEIRLYKGGISANTFNHELQHKIQEYAGMARGTNPESAGGFDRYQQEHGEWEARMSSARAKLTPEQRKAEAPWETKESAGVNESDTKIGDYNKARIRPDGTPEPAAPTPSIVTSKRSMKNAYMEEIQDRMHVLLEAERHFGRGVKDIYKEGSPYNAMRLLPGRNEASRMRYEKIYRDPLKKILKDGGVTADDVGHYMMAIDVPARNAKVIARNGKLDGSGMSDDMAREFIADMTNRLGEEKMTTIKKAADLLWKMQREGLERRLESGRISRDMFDKWTKEEPFHVPMRTDYSEDSDGIAYSTKQWRQNDFKTAEGRESIAASPVEFMLREYQDAVYGSNENDARKVLANYVRKHAELGDVKRGVRKTEGWSFTHGQLEDVVDPYYHEQRIKGGDGRPNLVAFKDGGDLMMIDMNGELGNRIAGAMTGRDVVRWSNNPIGRAYENYFLKPYASTATSWSPTFIGRNFMADLIESSINTIADKGILPGSVSVAKNIANAVMMQGTISAYNRTGEFKGKYADVMRRYVESGASIGGAANEGYDEIKNDLGKIKENGIVHALKIVPKFIELYNKQFEMATRLAVFKDSIDSGYSAGESAMRSREYSTDFNKYGNQRWMNSLWMFSGSVIGSAVRQVESLARGKHGVQALTGLLAYGLVESIIEHFWNVDSDSEADKSGKPSEKTMSEYARANSLYFRDGDKYYRVPFHAGPFSTVKYVGNVLGRILLGDITAGDAIRNATSETSSTLIHFLGIGDAGPNIAQTISPTVLTPGVQAWQNRDFADRPIERRMYSDTKPYSENGRKKTGEVFKWGARKLNEISGGNRTKRGNWDVSPEMLEHWWYSIGKNTARDVERVVDTVRDLANGDVNVDHVPFVSDVVRRVGDNTHNYFDAEHRFEAMKSDALEKRLSDSSRKLGNKIIGEISELGHYENGETKVNGKWKKTRNVSEDQATRWKNMRLRKQQQFLRFMQRYE